MTNETEKLRAELKQFVTDCRDEALLEEMLRISKEEIGSLENL